MNNDLSLLRASVHDGSGDQVFGIGLIFVTGAGVLALGVATMIVMSFFYRPFFRGEILTQLQSLPCDKIVAVDPREAGGTPSLSASFHT